MRKDMKRKKMLDTIVDNFAFEKVHSVMETLKWTWVSTNNKVPTVEQLRERALNLLLEALLGAEECIDLKPNVSYTVSTGGLEATAIIGEDYKVAHLRLKFVVTDWDVDIDEVES